MVRSQRGALPKRVMLEGRPEVGQVLAGQHRCERRNCSGTSIPVRWSDGTVTRLCSLGMAASATDPDLWVVARTNEGGSGDAGKR